MYLLSSCECVFHIPSKLSKISVVIILSRGHSWSFLESPCISRAVPRHIFVPLSCYGHPNIEPKILTKKFVKWHETRLGSAIYVNLDTLNSKHFSDRAFNHSESPTSSLKYIYGPVYPQKALSATLTRKFLALTTLVQTFTKLKCKKTAKNMKQNSTIFSKKKNFVKQLSHDYLNLVSCWILQESYKHLIGFYKSFLRSL